jgi:hypothetical protein
MVISILRVSRAFPRAGFEFRTNTHYYLHLSKGLGPYLSRYGLIPLSVTVIQTNQELFYLNKKTPAFVRACTVSH